MSNLTENSSFDPVYQLEITDPVLGGAGAISNRQAQSLVNRDNYIIGLIAGLTFSGVDLTTDQNVAGVKTFTSNFRVTQNVSVTGSVTAASGIFTYLSSSTGIFSGALSANSLTLTSPLGLSSGGTGSTTKNFVDLTNAQSIDGSKSFSTAPIMSGGGILPGSIPLNSLANTNFTTTINNTGKFFSGTADFLYGATLNGKNGHGGIELDLGGDSGIAHGQNGVIIRLTDYVGGQAQFGIAGFNGGPFSDWGTGGDDGNGSGHTWIKTLGSNTALILGGNNGNSGLRLDSSRNATFGNNVILKTVGAKLSIKEGTNASMGTSVLVAGAVIVSNTITTANSRIFLTIQSAGGTVGSVYISANSPGASFTISSTSGTDTSTVAWIVVEPA